MTLTVRLESETDFYACKGEAFHPLALGELPTEVSAPFFFRFIKAMVLVVLGRRSQFNAGRGFRRGLLIFRSPAIRFT